MLKYARKIQCFEHNSRSSHLWSFIFSSTCSLPHNFISSLLLRLDKWISFRFRTECVLYALGCMLLPLHTHSQYSRIFFLLLLHQWIYLLRAKLTVRMYHIYSIKIDQNDGWLACLFIFNPVTVASQRVTFYPSNKIWKR